MPPRRKPLTAAEREARIAALAAEPGSTGRSIATALKAEGFDVSPATVSRALVALRGRKRIGSRPARRHSPRATVARGKTPGNSDVLPTADEVTAAVNSPRELADFLAIAGQMASRAVAHGDDALLSRATQIAVQILAERRKAEPEVAPTDGMWISSGDVDGIEARTAAQLGMLARAVAAQVRAGAAEPSANAGALERMLFATWRGEAS